jgi:hypothetical protein
LLGLPRGLPRNTASLGERLAVARHSSVLVALLITILWGLGGFTVFTYFAVPLRGLGFDASQISLALLVFGGAAAIGNMLGGVLADRLGTLATAALGLAGMATALILHSLVLKLMPGQAHYAVLGTIFLWGISGWAFYPAQIASIIRIEPQASMIALSLNASSMYLGSPSAAPWEARCWPPSRQTTSAGSAERALRPRFWCTSPVAGRHGQNPSKLPVDGCFSGFRRPENWSKTHPRARETTALSATGTRSRAPFFCAQIRLRRELMPKRTDITTILIIGAGPIVIGQACEFDYSGTQAVKTLKEEGYRIVLVNSNPATIMTIRNWRMRPISSRSRPRSSPRSSRRNVTSSPAASRCCRPWAARPR